MRKLIIGFTGKAGAGKSTAARILKEHAGFEVVPFAAPLKAMCRAFGLSAMEMTVHKEIPLACLNGKSARQFMQLLGTEFGRKLIGPDMWVEAWRAGLLEVLADQCGELRVVVDDVRFENEAAAIRAEGGFIVCIERVGAGSATGGDHASELGVVPDLALQNDGDEDHLAAQVLGLLDRQFAAEAL